MIKVYLCHQFGGNVQNKLDVEGKVKKMYSRWHKEIKAMEINFISPIHNSGYLYGITEYQEGLNLCLDLLSACDYMMVFGDLSTSIGCTAEKEYCLEHGIPIIAYNIFKHKPELILMVKADTHKEGEI